MTAPAQKVRRGEAQTLLREVKETRYQNPFLMETGTELLEEKAQPVIPEVLLLMSDGQ